MSKAHRRQVIVLGGGVIGVSIATHLQRSGAEVILVTEAGPSNGASGRSLSWLNSAGNRSAPYHQLRMAGLDRYRTLSAHNSSTQPWLRFGGGLFWPSNDQAVVAQQRHRAELAHGYDSVLLTRQAAVRLVPDLNPEAVGDWCVYNPGEGWVSLPHLIEHLLGDFITAGGELHANAGHACVRTRHGRAIGIETASGTFLGADAVVVACGAATPAVVAELGVHIADRSPLSMLVTTEPVHTGLRAVLNTPRVAMRPDPNGGFVLDHAWYEQDIVEHADGTCTIDETVVKELLDEAAAILGVESLTARTWQLGRKPIPGDGEPVLGELERVRDCYVAFTHSGATLALITGELVAHELLTGTQHPMLQTFRPERFAG